MKLALSVEAGADDQLIFAQQLGAEQVVVECADHDAQTLKGVANRVAKVGLELAGCAFEPQAGAPATRAICQGITDAGKAGIRRVHLAWRDQEIADRVLRAAQEARVQVAWQVSGAPARVLAWATSPYAGLELCPGGFDTTVEAVGAIEGCGERLLAVLLANHRPSETQPCPLDEGAIDIPEVLRALTAQGYSGSLRSAPGPAIVDDTAWGHKRRAFDLGYLRSVMQALG